MTSAPVRVALAAAFLLAAAGAGVATYLAAMHLSGGPIACTGVGDCEYVNGSEYAHVAGVPVAVLGAGAYVGMMVTVVGAWWRRAAGLLLAAWGIALASALFSLYLTYIELFVLEAICAYCVASAVIVGTLLAALSGALWWAREDVAAAMAGSPDGSVGTVPR
jgi:uncharacterized membrane protein